MASLMAQPAVGQVASRGRPARLVAPVSGLRVRPFKSSRQQLVKPCKAAVDEAAAVEELEFDFNLNEAKKNNEYSAADVEAALRFYEGEDGAEPAANSPFATNQTGLEDASFFDDIDNNEAYDADEYIVAGIPEAAPKKRGKGRGREGEAGGDGDDEVTREAKELSRMKALEDERIMEAALEDEFGAAAETSQAMQLRVDQPGVWDWLMDDSAEATEAVDLDGKLFTVKHSSAQLPEDQEVLAGLSTLNVEELDSETRGMLELVVGYEDLNDEDMRALDVPEDASDLPAVQALSDADVSRLDALASQPLDQLQIEEPAMPEGLRMLVASSTTIDKAAVDQYLESLRAAAKAGSNLSDDEVKGMFTSGSEPLELAGDEAEENVDIAAALAVEEPMSPGEPMDFAEADQLIITAEEEASYDIKEIKRELQQLSAVDELTELDLPTEEQLSVLEECVMAGSDFEEMEDQRKLDVAAAIARGEAKEDDLAEDLEDIADMEDDLLADWEDNEEDVLGALGDEDTENWQERILELTRVTKVVKGGKIMGFRCTAVVGNGNGLVGVGCQAGREVAVAVKRTLVDAKRNVVQVPLVGAGTIPHKVESKYHAARIVLVPAAEGSGVLAGGAVRSVLELAGVQNVLGKRLGSRSLLNNARCTVKALTELKTLNEVAQARGVPMSQLLLPQ